MFVYWYIGNVLLRTSAGHVVSIPANASPSLVGFDISFLQKLDFYIY
jgi:hypothetical protein